MGKAWDKLWTKFDEFFEVLPEAIDEAMESASQGFVQCEITNGNVTLTGSIKSLRINGRQIRLPEEVVRPK